MLQKGHFAGQVFYWLHHIVELRKLPVSSNFAKVESMWEPWLLTERDCHKHVTEVSLAVSFSSRSSSFRNRVFPDPFSTHSILTNNLEEVITFVSQLRRSGSHLCVHQPMVFLIPASTSVWKNCCIQPVNYPCLINYRRFPCKKKSNILISILLHACMGFFGLNSWLSHWQMDLNFSSYSKWENTSFYRMNIL